MNRIIAAGLAAALAASALLAVPAVAHEEDPPTFLLFTGTYGFRHESIREGVAELQRQANETGKFKLYTTSDTNDLSLLDPAVYDQVDGVILVNTTGLAGSPLTDDQKADFIDFFDCGASLVAIHAAADSGSGWPAYDDLLGSKGFDSHPHFSFETRDMLVDDEFANQRFVSDLTIQVEDPAHITTRPWSSASNFKISEEIYRYKEDPRTDPNLHVVLSVDEETHYWKPVIGPGESAGGIGGGGIDNPVPNPMNMNPVTQMPEDNPVAWVKPHGTKGSKVFYTNLGHNPSTWDRPDFQAHIGAGIEWLAAARPDRTCTAERFAD